MGMARLTIVPGWFKLVSISASARVVRHSSTVVLSVLLDSCRLVSRHTPPEVQYIVRYDYMAWVRSTSEMLHCACGIHITTDNGLLAPKYREKKTLGESAGSSTTLVAAFCPNIVFE